MRGLPWKESPVQAGGLDEKTSSLFLIVSILFLKKSRKRFGRPIRGKTVGRVGGFFVSEQLVSHTEQLFT